MKRFISLAVIVMFAGRLVGQDTLPRFTIVESGDKVVVSWTNPHTNVVQLSVQRSYDSLRFFSTIFSAPSPNLPQNGFTDQKKPAKHVYYRIFYVLEGGSFVFSSSKSAAGSTATSATTGNNRRDINSSLRDISNRNLLNVVPGDRRMVTIKIRDTVFKQVSINAFRNFRDSILSMTKDTLYSVNDSLVGLNPFIGSITWKPSSYIYVSKEGYINISLPAPAEKKYTIKFFEENGSSLFEVADVKESPLIIDKSNFIHAGWFLFELYEDNKLKEKNKLYLPKDF